MKITGAAIALAGLFLSATIPAQGGLRLPLDKDTPARLSDTKVFNSCLRACDEALARHMDVYLTRWVPVLSHPAERFDPDATTENYCPKRLSPGPQVFGILLAPGEIEGLPTLPGAGNDIRLMEDVMRDRGVVPDRIFSSFGSEATRSSMLSAMAKPLPCLRERDQVVLVYSGHAGVYELDWLDIGNFLKDFCSGAEGREHESFCSSVKSDTLSVQQLNPYRDTLMQHARRWLEEKQPQLHFLPGNKMHLLLGVGTVAGRSPPLIDGLTAVDVSNFVTRVRNTGADAFLIVDASNAAAADLLALQKEAASPDGWAVYGNVMLKSGGFPKVQDSENPLAPVRLFGNGEFAVLYSSTPDGEASEYKQGADEVQLGALVFRVAEALRARAAVKFRDMALEIARSFDEYNRLKPRGVPQEPVFMASNLDIELLAPRDAPRRTENGIEIISPTPKRGAAGVEDEVFTVVARYSGEAKAQMAIVDGDLVPVDANGQFRGDVSDAGSKFTVALRVLGANYETLATAELRLREKPAEPVIASPARKVALVIANQNYNDPGFPTLRTPFADAEAVAALLRERFGFVTRLETGDKPLELFLKDATKAQIEQVLFQLRRRLTAEDQLLVYYAGHGENDPDLGAFWIPADGEAGADFTWVESHEITTALKRMNAASVLVISDSCYAGGLSRGGQEPLPDSQARERYLAKASRLKARQLMASGGDEPVEDGGGGGHSVFAKALIEALQSMPEETFTASELFEQKVKPAVISSANALTEGQTPGFSRIARAGDEPGSEFVFQAAQ